MSIILTNVRGRARHGPLATASLGVAALVAGSMLVLGLPGPARAQVPESEFAARRARLVEQLGDGVYWFEGARAPENDYTSWAQEAYFHYLTGVEEPDASLLMVKSDELERQILFVRERNVNREIWEGERLGTRRAAELTGMESRSRREVEETLQEVLDRPFRAVIALQGPDESRAVADILRSLEALAAESRDSSVELIDARDALDEMRAIKSAAEIELLRMASAITAEAHLAAMEAVEPTMNEFEIQALIEYNFRRYGAQRPGFASIIGSGPNSTALHYNANDRFFDDDDMLVMDVGAEYQHYSTDITRSIPVSGRFSAEQRDIYEIVLAAQLAAEETAREIGVSWDAVNRAAREVLAEGLARLGLIESADARLPGGRSQLSLFYMHGLGHGIGLDVHDPGSGTIEIGYAFTIEPGLYIREDALDRIGEGPAADALREKLRPAVMKYAEIGVRVEDSYAFTDQGLVRLSAGIPRTIDEIEATMAGENYANHHRNTELLERHRRLRRRAPR